MSGILLDSSIIIAAERRTLEIGAVTAGRLDLTHLVKACTGDYV